MIYHEGHLKGSIYRNGAKIIKAYRNGQVVYGGDPITNFIHNAESDGATFVDEEILRASYEELNQILRDKQAIVLLPGVYKSGTVYGFNNKTGALVPFSFSRASSATLWDKNGDMSSVSSHIPRIEYDPITGDLLGYRLDKSATNYATNSNSFPSAAAWQDVTTGHMYKGISFTEGRTSNASASIRVISGLPSGQSRICISMYLRKISAGSTIFGVFVDRTGVGNTSGVIRFNIETGAIVATGTPPNLTYHTSSEDIGGGYYRVSVVLEDWLEGGTVRLGYSNDSSGVYHIANLQIEAGEYATSYIPTAGSQVTRVGASFASNIDIINDEAGTVFTDMSDVGTGLIYRIRRGTGTGTTAGFIYYQDTPGQIQTFAGEGSAPAADRNSEANENGRNLVAVSFGTDLLIAANGSDADTGSYGSSFGTDSSVLHLYHSDSTGLVYSHIKALVILPEQLTDSELTEITS